MATAFTLATLKTAIKNHVEDQGTDFDSNVETIIKLGEDMILKDLPLSIFDVRGNVTITAGTQTATKPTDALSIYELYYVSGSTRVILLPRSYSFCIDYARTTTQATPKYFAEDYSETAMWLAPNPNVTVTAEALYAKRPASLVTTSPSFFSTNLGDLLLAACLVAAERFNLGWAESKDWLGEYGRLLQSATYEMRNLLRPDYRARPAVDKEKSE